MICGETKGCEKWPLRSPPRFGWSQWQARQTNRVDLHLHIRRFGPNVQNLRRQRYAPPQFGNLRIQMTPDAVSLAQYEIARLQLWITALAIFLGPLAGVLFTVWFQARRDKRSEMHRLFYFLMGARKAPLVSPAMATALNSIDVAFHGQPEVRKVWKEYYPLLNQYGSEAQRHKWLELLSEMAKALGYPSLTQVDIDKFYVPQGHFDDIVQQQTVNGHLLRVLQNTERFVVIQRPVEAATDEPR